MRVVVTGGTGFIGQALVPHLAEAGYTVVVCSRNPDKVGELFGPLQGNVVGADWGKGVDGPWAMQVDGAHAVINLAGSPVATRWTSEAKKRILNSRVKAGEAVTKAVHDASTKPKVVVQGSAVGYYGFESGDAVKTEDSPAGKGFLADVCREWEPSTAAVEAMGVRRVIVRTGVVLGKGGGALEKMLPAFRFFVGGHPGSGQQYVSWVHRLDEVRAIRFLMEKENLEGPFNVCSPNPLTMKDFCNELGRVMGRPSWAPVPGMALKMLFGKMAQEMLLSGQRVLPKRLLDSDFYHEYKNIAQAFESIVG